MGDPEHIRLVPLIEAALAIMRLSCEKVGRQKKSKSVHHRTSVEITWLTLGHSLRTAVWLDATQPARCQLSRDSASKPL